MRIEGLVPDARRPGSIRVIVGGRPAWTVPADVVTALALSEGATVGGAAVDRLDQAADEEGAFRAGLRALERRSHSALELQRKLERKGHPPAAVTGAVARLQRLTLIDDVAFAATYVAARSERGRGPVRLRHDLAALGVESSIIERAIGSLVRDEADPLAQPRALALKRVSQLRGLPREARRRRLTAFLARRGFSGSDVRAIVDAVLKGEPA